MGIFEPGPDLATNNSAKAAKHFARRADHELPFFSLFLQYKVLAVQVTRRRFGFLLSRQRGATLRLLDNGCLISVDDLIDGCGRPLPGDVTKSGEAI